MRRAAAAIRRPHKRVHSGECGATEAEAPAGGAGAQEPNSSAGRRRVAVALTVSIAIDHFTARPQPHVRQRFDAGGRSARQSVEKQSGAAAAAATRRRAEQSRIGIGVGVECRRRLRRRRPEGERCERTCVEQLREPAAADADADADACVRRRLARPPAERRPAHSHSDRSVARVQSRNDAPQIARAALSEGCSSSVSVEVDVDVDAGETSATAAAAARDSSNRATGGLGRRRALAGAGDMLSDWRFNEFQWSIESSRVSRAQDAHVGRSRRRLAAPATRAGAASAQRRRRLRGAAPESATHADEEYGPRPAAAAAAAAAS